MGDDPSPSGMSQKAKTILKAGGLLTVIGTAVGVGVGVGVGTKTDHHSTPRAIPIAVFVKI